MDDLERNERFYALLEPAGLEQYAGLGVSAAHLSEAISLKRIADALERREEKVNLNSEYETERAIRQYKIASERLSRGLS